MPSTIPNHSPTTKQSALPSYCSPYTVKYFILFSEQQQRIHKPRKELCGGSAVLSSHPQVGGILPLNFSLWNGAPAGKAPTLPTVSFPWAPSSYFLGEQPACTVPQLLLTLGPPLNSLRPCNIKGKRALIKAWYQRWNRACFLCSSFHLFFPLPPAKRVRSCGLPTGKFVLSFPTARHASQKIFYRHMQCGQTLSPLSISMVPVMHLFQLKS